MKQAPSRLNTAEIVAALMLHSGFANYQPWSINSGVLAIDGLTSFYVSLVAQDPSYTTYPTAQFNSEGRETVILGYNVAVDYTGGGAAVDANVPLSIATQRRWPPAAGANCGLLETWAIVVATRLRYSFAFPFWGKQHSNYYTSVNTGAEKIWVPAGSEFALNVNREAAGSWPAGTTMSIQALGVTVPKGICPPLC